MLAESNFRKLPKCNHAITLNLGDLFAGKIFMSVSPKCIKPVRFPVCLTKIKFSFIFILSNKKRVTNRSAPLNPDFLFVKSPTTFFKNLGLVA